MLKTKDKEKLIAEYKTHPTDTGSTEVQIALISEEIDRLVSHLKRHKKDFGSKRALLKLVAKRRTLLSYLKRKSSKRHGALAKKIGIST
ncbi:MAG: 30S ribosomal protein S15 [Candidatus Wildermuthbacteria bacterium]|nr:30S ribosomal protein S15 [Candidatus Wildermuthbacteria bacterium]